MAYDLTIVVPTLYERQNIEPLLAALTAALEGIDWEVIFVDDNSPDGTSILVREIGVRDPRVRGIQRIGRRGLASACIEGMLASNAPYLAVMDADLQHDERLLPAMLETLRSSDAELVVGSRYMAGGSTGLGLAGVRKALSRLATRLSRWVIRRDLTDPMSGFFMLRRSLLERTVRDLYGEGFKILLDFITSAGHGLKFAELPYTMRFRHAGESKLDTTVVLEFVLMLINKKFRGWLPPRFVMFVLVGLSGVGVHMMVLYGLFQFFGSGFALAQGIATWAAMTSNFFMNNLLTYYDRRLTGWHLLSGLLSFYLACGFGAVVNVALADFLFEHGLDWRIAGICGAGVGAVWNYVMTSLSTWSNRSTIGLDRP
jgi:dolichol-phosphate mannosyltransferase